MTAKEYVAKVIDREGSVRHSVLRGVIASTKNDKPAIELRFTEAGKPVVSGSILCEDTYEWNGKTRTEKYFAFFSAFDDTALALAELNEGDHVTLVTKRSRRKGKNDRWYDNETVEFFEKH